MAKDVIYVRHRVPEAKAFRSPTGMVGTWTATQAEKVAAHARLLSPKPGQGKGYATGETASSIRSGNVSQGRKGPEATISAGTEHAFHLHEGTAPHVIKARPGKKMVFFLRSAGRVVYDNLVKHPGTKAQPFLSDALKKVFGGPGR